MKEKRLFDDFVNLKVMAKLFILFNAFENAEYMEDYYNFVWEV